MKEKEQNYYWIGINMAEALEGIKKDDIEKFIVILMYRVSPWDWPRVTIVLSRVTIYYRTKSSRPLSKPLTKIHRNEPRTHAEIFFSVISNKKLTDCGMTKKSELTK